MAERLIACFCGCSELEVKQIRLLTKCNIQEFLGNPEARRLLGQYIIHELDDEEDNLTLKYLRMYETSLEYLKNPQRDERCVRVCRNNLNDVDVYPNEKLERLVKEALRTRDPDIVYEALQELQQELQYQIEFSDELAGMKEKLLAKVDATTRK